MCGESSIILSVHDVTTLTPNTALQVRTSYVPQEILWGYRFEHKCVAYDKAMNKYAVSYTAINSFIPDRTPRWVYSVSGLSCPEAEAYLTVIFHSFLHNNNINSDYILGAIIYFTPHGNCSSYF